MYCIVPCIVYGLSQGLDQCSLSTLVLDNYKTLKRSRTLKLKLSELFILPWWMAKRVFQRSPTPILVTHCPACLRCFPTSTYLTEMNVINGFLLNLMTFWVGNWIICIRWRTVGHEDQGLEPLVYCVQLFANSIGWYRYIDITPRQLPEPFT